MSEGEAAGGGRPVVVTIFNQKGGIGKTTTTVNLAVALAAMGRRVVLIDLDSQSNATSSLGMTAPPASGSYRLVTGAATLTEAMVATPFPGLWLCPATDELVGADIELALAEAPQTHLRGSIHDHPADVDFVLIDCPPALGMLPVNALVASDLAILPVSPEPLAREGLLKAWRHIHRIRVNLNQSLFVMGVLLTMVDRMAVHREFGATVRAEFGSRVLPVTVPRDPVILAASAQEMPVVVFDPETAASKAYIRLAHLLVLAARRHAETGERDEEAAESAEWLKMQTQEPDYESVTKVLLNWRDEVARDIPPAVPAEPAAATPPAEERAWAETAEPPPQRGCGMAGVLGFVLGAGIGVVVGLNLPAIVALLIPLLPR